MLERLRRHWWRRRLKDERFAFLFDEDASGELVSLDCETTSLNVREAQLLAVAAMKIRGDRILTSERLELIVRPDSAPGTETVLIHHLRPVDIAAGVPVEEAIERVLHFVGSRPLVGYYLEFDVAILNKYVRPKLGVPLPNRQIEVSALYYDAKTRHLPGIHVDLSFRAIRHDLGLPERAEHDAFNDALLAAMMYLRLTRSGGDGA